MTHTEMSLDQLVGMHIRASEQRNLEQERIPHPEIEAAIIVHAEEPAENIQQVLFRRMPVELCSDG